MILARRHVEPPVGAANLEYELQHEPGQEYGNSDAHGRNSVCRP